jgi:hypothetical protein
MSLPPSSSRLKLGFLVLLLSTVLGYVPRHYVLDQRLGYWLIRRSATPSDDQWDEVIVASAQPNNDREEEQNNVAQLLSTKTGAATPPLHLFAANQREAKEPFDWDTFLDTPFFDPVAVSDDQSSNPLLRRLASFIQNDYNKAEMVLSCAFLCVMIVVSQELVRFQIHGDNYVPFVGGGHGGGLF